MMMLGLADCHGISVRLAESELVEERVAELDGAIWLHLSKAGARVKALRGVHRRERSQAERVVVSPAGFSDHALEESTRDPATPVGGFNVHALDFPNGRTQRVKSHTAERGTILVRDPESATRRLVRGRQCG